MKSIRRHELQRNMLDVELRKVWEFLRKRGNVIAWVLLGTAVASLGIYWYVNRTRQETSAIQAQYANLMQMQPGEQRLAGLELLAGKTSLPRWAALATAGVGDEYAWQLMVQWPQFSESERDDLRQKAQAYYQRTIDTYPQEQLAVAKARFGQGKLAESFGDLPAAQAAYQAVLQMPGLAGDPITAIADGALKRMELFQGTVHISTSAPTTTSTSAESPEETPTTGATTGRSTATATASAPAASGAQTGGRMADSNGRAVRPRPSPTVQPASAEGNAPQAP